MNHDIPSTPADGNMRVLVVAALENPAQPTLAELNTPTAVDISCYLTSDGYTPSLEQQVIEDNRLCSTEEYEKPGRSKRGLSVTYIDNTNSPDEATYNKAKTTLVPKSRHYIVTRRGVAWDEDFTVGQTVVVTPIECGQYDWLPPEANSVLKISQKQFITGRTVEAVLPAA